MSYIAFIDMVGTKNLANYDATKYMENIVAFQSTIVLHLKTFKKQGRLYFFSDCAYIESDNIEALIKFLSLFRNELANQNIFLKGAIAEGILGAITGFEMDRSVKARYGEEIYNKYSVVKGTLEEYKDEIRGTLFFSQDIAEVFKMQDNLKGIACSVHIKVLNSKAIEKTTVDSFYIKDAHKNTLEFFKDIKYTDEFTSVPNVIDNIFKLYAISNTYSLKYGRYYLTILASLINSCKFSSLKYDKATTSSSNSKFVNAPPIFSKIMNLRKAFPILYEKAVGLEFIYFTLLNKIYDDKKGRDETTKEVLKIILNSKRFINKYMNSLELLPKKLISDENKGRLIADYFDIYNKNNQLLL